VAVGDAGRRRDRLRTATEAEIKTTAWSLIGENGPDALSLRAIARHIGMATGTVYGYYASRDDLITALISDAYDDLVSRLGTAMAHRRGADKLMAYGQTFRQWAVERPDLFRLVYGDPVSGYRPPEGGAAPEAESRACGLLIELVEDMSPDAAAQMPQADWEDFAPGFVAAARAAHPALTAGALAAVFRLWGRLHGLVALEIHGHLRDRVHDTA
jgi:AcrR family transcriptional regulator